MTTIRTKASIRLPMSIDHNAIHTRIKTLPSIEEKCELVGKHNSFLYIFGRGLKPINHYTNEYREGEDE